MPVVDTYSSVRRPDLEEIYRLQRRFNEVVDKFADEREKKRAEKLGNIGVKSERRFSDVWRRELKIDEATNYVPADVLESVYDGLSLIPDENSVMSAQVALRMMVEFLDKPFINDKFGRKVRLRTNFRKLMEGKYSEMRLKEEDVTKQEVMNSEELFIDRYNKNKSSSIFNPVVMNAPVLVEELKNLPIVSDREKSLLNELNREVSLLPSKEDYIQLETTIGFFSKEQNEENKSSKVVLEEKKREIQQKVIRSFVHIIELTNSLLQEIQQRTNVRDFSNEEILAIFSNPEEISEQKIEAFFSLIKKINEFSFDFKHWRKIYGEAADGSYAKEYRIQELQDSVKRLEELKGMMKVFEGNINLIIELSDLFKAYYQTCQNKVEQGIDSDNGAQKFIDIYPILFQSLENLSEQLLAVPRTLVEMEDKKRFKELREKEAELDSQLKNINTQEWEDIMTTYSNVLNQLTEYLKI